MKKSGLFLISLMVLILSLGVLSCEVGLGAQVDTLPPTVEITSPIGSPRVRGDFAIKGNWNDDGKLAKIDVELVGANGKYKISDPSSFTISDKTWQVNVPAKTQKYLDGEYTAKVTCTDDGNRPTIVSQNIVIDNTPPVVIIETPAFAANSSDKDTFGKLLSFTGTVYDETRVNEIKLNFGEGYGDAGLIIPEDQPERTISSYNPETVKFAIDLTDDETKDLYKGIYGWGKLDPESENPETPIRFYTLTATDNAQCYPIEGPQTDEDKIGNKAEVFYLATNENVRRWIDNYHVDAATIYKVLNGTYKKTGVNDLDPNKINDIKNNLSSAATNAGQFELNPKNNPCYYTDNANLLTDENGFESSRITANEESALIVKIEKGIDGYQIDKDNVKIYLYEFDTNNDDLDGFTFNRKTI